MNDEDQSAPERRKGRPAGKRGTFTFRVTPDLRARLEAAAASVGRPVSEEIERRLERSFENIDLLMSYFGSSETLKLAQSVSLLARVVETRTGKRWTEDVGTKEDFHGAISRFFHLYFYEQGEENNISSLGLERLGQGHSAAETVAEVMGLKSKAREEMEAFLATPEGKAALERSRKAVGSKDGSSKK